MSVSVWALPGPLRFEPSHEKVSRSHSGSRAALLGSHCSDSTVPNPWGAGTGCQRLGCAPSDLPVSVTRREKKVMWGLRNITARAKCHHILAAAAHEEKQLSNSAVFIRPSLIHQSLKCPKQNLSFHTAPFLSNTWSLSYLWAVILFCELWLVTLDNPFTVLAKE